VKHKKTYAPDRSVARLRDKARHAWGRQEPEEPEEPQSAAELAPVAGPTEVRKEGVAKPVRIDPLNYAPVGTEGGDRDAGEDRIRARALERATPVEIVRQVQDDHDFERETGLVYVALLRHSRGLNARGVPPGWANVQTNEESILPMIEGGVSALQRGIAC